MDDFKNVFITEELKKPMQELQDLNSLMKKKKAELKKAVFYTKHPELLQAKKVVDSKLSEEKVVKFNESVKEPEPIREEPPAVTVTTPAPKEIKTERPLKVTMPSSQPVRLAWGEKLF